MDATSKARPVPSGLDASSASSTMNIQNSLHLEVDSSELKTPALSEFEVPLLPGCGSPNPRDGEGDVPLESRDGGPSSGPDPGCRPAMVNDKLSLLKDSECNVLPSTGVLLPLKTTLETKSRDRTVEVYVTSVAPKQASNTLNLIRSLIPDDGGLDLQHLRRFAKYADVPAIIRSSFEAEKLKHEDRTSEEAPASEVSTDLFLVVGSINAISRTTLLEYLSGISSEVVIFTALVPLLAPTSPEQATRWTSQYWPIVYKKSNPFGPHPSIVLRAEEEIRGDVRQWMDLAVEVANLSKKTGFGEAVGVVVVERKDGVARAVAVAGDARWHNWPQSGSGNVTAHAALRAIAMVATELRAESTLGDPPQQITTPDFATPVSSGEDRDPANKVNKFGEDVITKVGQREEGPAAIVSGASSASPEPKDGGIRYLDSPPTNANRSIEMVGQQDSTIQTSNPPIFEIFQDKALFEIETRHLRQSGDGNGYLCHSLEIYSTHEPCVMCSMAIVHSRFSKVVFARRMQETGGMCADGTLGHGLFWRKELNWNLLAWEWSDLSGVSEQSMPTNLHA